MANVSEDAVKRLIEVFREMVKDGALDERAFRERALRVKLVGAVAPPSDAEYENLVKQIFASEEAGR